MDDAAIAKYILESFEGVDIAFDAENSFFFYDAENKIPFITIVRNDKYDSFSGLDREGVFRLNIGIGKQTFRSLFPEAASHDDPAPAPEYDFTGVDRVMPHPVYGRMYWVCVLNPGETTMDRVRPLLAEAYEIAKKKYERAAGR